MDLKLADFVGNHSLVSLLRRGDLPPAAIFSGPNGVGKRTLSILLAGLANCARQADGDLCGRCASCVQLRTVDDPAVEGLRCHPDVLLADTPWVACVVKKHNKTPNPQIIPVDVAREITQQAQYRPLQGPRRFFIIDEAEKLNESAQNSLLKTLEEPPETTRVILVTAFPDRLLPTIHSRCQRFNFRPLRRQELAQYLVQMKSRDENEARLLAAFSMGSIGTALQLDLSAVTEDRDLLLELLDRWIRNRSFEDVFRFSEGSKVRATLKNRDRTQQFLGQLELLGQDLYLTQIGTPDRVVNQDVLPGLQPLAKLVSLDWIDNFLYHVKEAQRDLQGYVNPLICFETLWLATENNDARPG